MLDEESGKLGLRDHRELRVSAADVPFPVRIFCGVGCCVDMDVIRRTPSK